MPKDDRAFMLKQTQEADASAAPVPHKEYIEIQPLEVFSEYDGSIGNQSLRPIEVSSSGVTFGTGARRDALAPRYDLIPPCALKRLAQIYTEGAEHYGAHNWQKGMDYSDTINHALEHLLKYMRGDKEEDHLAKVAWAMFALMYYDFTGKGNNDLYKWEVK